LPKDEITSKVNKSDGHIKVFHINELYRTPKKKKTTTYIERVKIVEVEEEERWLPRLVTIPRGCH